jgi:putative transposase
MTNNQITDQPTVNLAEASPRAIERAQRRFAIIEQALALYTDGRKPPSVEIERLAAAHDISTSTLYHWLAKYREAQFPGLLDRHGQTKGRFTALPPAVQDFIKEQYLTQFQPSPTTVYRRVADPTEGFCAHQGLPAPSQATVNRFLRALPPAAVVLGRLGPDEYKAKCEPKCERDLNALGVGEWWVSDHREFDVFVKIGWWDSAKREWIERFVRPWLTAWLDLRSRCCLGWQVHINPTSDTIACALRASILRHGFPTHLYRDNGKDFVCKYFGGKSRVYKGVHLSHEAMALLRPGVLSEAGVRLHAALPYTPWSKPIESWFGHTLPEWEKMLPGWCGRDNKHRPEKLDREIAQGELLTLEEFIPRVASRLNDYNATPTSGLKGASPNDLWDGLAIERPAPRTLDLLLMRHKPVTVTAQGIRLFGRLYSHPSLADKWKQQVHVKYDQNELGRLIVFDPTTDKVLCEAVNEPAMRMGASREDLKALHQRKRAAKLRVQQYLQDRQVLFNPDQVLGELAQQRRAAKVVNLTPPDPAPAPGTRPIPRVVPVFDQAASAIERTRVPRRLGGRISRQQEPCTPVAAPAAAASSPIDDDEAERESIWAEINEAGALRQAAVARRKALDEADRESIMREVLSS